MTIGLKGIEFFLPGEVMDVENHYSYLDSQIEKMPLDERKIIRASIPDTVHRLKDASALEIMALNAAQKALDSSGVSANEIDCLLVTQMGGKQFMPLIASYLQLNLGLGTDIIARNVNDHGISIINIIKLARIYIKSGTCKNILIVAASALIGGKYGFGADLTDPMCMNLGDGAAAAIISEDETNCRILGEYMETYPLNQRKTGTLNGDYGEIRAPLNRDLCFAAEMDDAYGAYLERSDFQFDEIASVSGFFSNTLVRSSEKLGIDLADIKHLVTSHNGLYLDIWKRDIFELNLEIGIMKNNYKAVGNTGCADVLITLSELSKQNCFKKGDIIALWTISKTVQIGIAFLEWL